MAVEINGVPGTPNNQVKQTSSSNVNRADSNTHSSSNVTTGSPIADSFTISQKAERLRVIESTINTQPDIDDARIETLKVEIDAGRYDIDPTRVAEKLIELEAQFVA